MNSCIATNTSRISRSLTVTPVLLRADSNKCCVSSSKTSRARIRSCACCEPSTIREFSRAAPADATSTRSRRASRKFRRANSTDSANRRAQTVSRGQARRINGWQVRCIATARICFHKSPANRAQIASPRSHPSSHDGTRLQIDVAVSATVDVESNAQARVADRSARRSSGRRGLPFKPANRISPAPDIRSNGAAGRRRTRPCPQHADAEQWPLQPPAAERVSSSRACNSHDQPEQPRIVGRVVGQHVVLDRVERQRKNGHISIVVRAVGRRRRGGAFYSGIPWTRIRVWHLFLAAIGALHAADRANCGHRGRGAGPARNDQQPRHRSAAAQIAGRRAGLLERSVRPVAEVPA